MSNLLYLLIICYIPTLLGKFLPGQCQPKYCLNEGRCFPGIESNSHWCRCAPGFTGANCELSVCPDICYNGGSCVRRSTDRPDDFACLCPLGFEGQYCDRPVRDSVCKREDPCGSHGRCYLVNSLEEYTCSCHRGWTGRDCSQRDPCPPSFCQNGGICRVDGDSSAASSSSTQISLFSSTSSSLNCQCPDNFHGERCQFDVDECAHDPCHNGGLCTNKKGTFECSCPQGFSGSRCEFPVLSTIECSRDQRAQTACRNGGQCLAEEGERQRRCVCPPMFEGHFCELDVDECSTVSPCSNGGTCLNTEGGYTCLCPSGFEGDDCQVNTDECSSSPCAAGSTCVDGLAMFSCLCPPGRTGIRCQLEDKCATRQPCANGKCSTDDVTGDYSCQCDKGFQGLHCDEDVDECSLAGGDLCYNNGTCVNTPGSYHCQCEKPFTGSHCDQLMTSCEPSPCLNHGTCIDHIESFICVCKTGFSGDHCEIHGVTCPEQDCQNGGVCDGEVCICPRGFTGMFCEERGIPCGMQTCPISSICIEGDDESSAVCGCPAGYFGLDCQLRQPQRDDCSANPCLHGNCSDLPGGVGGYECACPKGYTGRNCEDPISQCTPSTCSNGGSCVHADDGFVCRCLPPYYGIHCELESDPCASHNCSLNSLCLPSTDSTFRCQCKPGFGGRDCDEDVNECLLSPPVCSNGGRCSNHPGSYHCLCPPHFTGRHCENDVINHCQTNPCNNNGSCVSEDGGFRCVCQKGFHGQRCQSDIDDCLASPCLNGASCLDDVDSYKCVCLPGFSGRNCHVNVDECRPKGLCLNGGSCVDGVASYRCECARGFSGENCQNYVDIDQFEDQDRLDRSLCVSLNCSSKSSNGVCDPECNRFACSFDGGDCSAARERPYEKCAADSYCARVFHDGKCNEICNTESCLFDGFDCSPSPSSSSHPSSCSSHVFCQNRFANGICDSRCDTPECGFDGGDCDKEKEMNTLSGDVVLVVLTSPDVFSRRVNEFLMRLSSSLRASLRIKSDEDGPMVFQWNDGQTGDRVPIHRDQSLSVSFGGVLRARRSPSLAPSLSTPSLSSSSHGVLVWIRVDVSSCTGDCFSDLDTVASYLGRAQATEAVSPLDMPIYSAMIRREPSSTPTDSSGSSSTSSTFFAIILSAIGVMMVVATVFVLQEQRTRKRHLIHAPTWFPPTEAQNNQNIRQQTDHALRMNFYASQGDIYSSCKRTKLDAAAMNYYHPEVAHVLPPPMPNIVTVKPLPPVIYPEMTAVHHQAASDDPIPLPIDRSAASTACAPAGRTPLHLLSYNHHKNRKENEDLLLGDVQNLVDAGININAQDSDEETALFVAVRNGYFSLARRLLQLGADPCRMNKRNSTPLHQAAQKGDIQMTKLLLAEKKVVDEINEVDVLDKTALMEFCCEPRSHFRVAELLIEKGADPSFPGDKSALTYRGRTALHYATMINHTAMMRFLIEKGANKDAQDREDCTPMFLAALHGKEEAVQTLVDAGASTEITDQKERTPCQVAQDTHYAGVVRILTPGGQEMELKEAVVQQLKPTNHGQNNKNTVRQTKKPTRRNKAQPLTPPSSDGGAGTPSPSSEAFQLSRPLLCPPPTSSTLRAHNDVILDSPNSDPQSLAADQYSPQGTVQSMAMCGMPGGFSSWSSNSSAAIPPCASNSSFVNPSPPYEDTTSGDYCNGMGATSFYNNTSQYGAGGMSTTTPYGYDSYQDSGHHSTFNQSSSAFLPSCQYAQQNSQPQYHNV